MVGGSKDCIVLCVCLSVCVYVYGRRGVCVRMSVCACACVYLYGSRGVVCVLIQIFYK